MVGMVAVRTSSDKVNRLHGMKLELLVKPELLGCSGQGSLKNPPPPNSSIF
jgi:hypothetical protein